jgi:dihydrodipicolinate synthase/N-acetylneuraminate lyase
VDDSELKCSAEIQGLLRRRESVSRKSGREGTKSLRLPFPRTSIRCRTLDFRYGIAYLIFLPPSFAGVAMKSFPLKGIIPPLVTPLTGRDRLDVEALERLLEHVISGGVHGVFILGTTGEGPSLSHRLQREMVRQTCRVVRGRVPVLVGVTNPSIVESLDLTKTASENGAEAVVLAPPFYFPMHQADLTKYVREFARESALPMFLYNMPSHTKVAFELETIRQLLDEPRVIGVKDSSGNMLFFNQLLELTRSRSDLAVFMGPEELTAQGVMAGAAGGVSGGANLLPRLYVDLYEAAVCDDVRLVMKLQHRVMRLSSKIYQVGAAPTGYLTGLKTALSLVGLCQPIFAEPLHPLAESQVAALRQHLLDLGEFKTVAATLSS